MEWVLLWLGRPITKVSGNLALVDICGGLRNIDVVIYTQYASRFQVMNVF